jgi:hypothetical protein
MKTPRVKDFDSNAKVPVLKSSLDNMPAIGKPKQSGQNTDLLANEQTSKIVNQQNSFLVNKQTSKEVNQQNSKLVNQLTSKTTLSTKEKTKYGTYLREDSIMNIQIAAAQNKKKTMKCYKISLIFILRTTKNNC